MVQGFLEVEDLQLRSAFNSLGLLRVVEDTKKEFISAGSIITSAPHRILPAWSMGVNNPSILIIDVDSGGQPANPSFMRDMDEHCKHRSTSLELSRGK
jgi:hypothetical protein